MIVALLNQQHGVGKTTLALHLAGVWSCQSQRVTVIDADPQGCALECSEMRAREWLRGHWSHAEYASPRGAEHRS
jgi:chromosome partitioning protein